jgi:LysR family transcriptional regulator, benzoate and cis,cis-muconate-responsive activator of ben and cat genes
MEILHLRYFVAVAEALSFTRAAERLGMSTSPLSQRIKGLEQELGIRLFIRDNRTVTLTPFGEALLPLARSVVEGFDAIRPTMRALARSGHNSIRLGLSGEVPTRLRDTALHLLASEHPEVVVQIYSGNTRTLLEMLGAGELEMAFVTGPVARPGLGSMLFSRRPAGVVVARGIGYDDKSSVRLDELRGLSFATRDADLAPEAYGHIDRLLRQSALNERHTFAYDDLAGLRHLVAARQAFTLSGMDDGILHHMFEGEDVVFLAIEGVHLEFTTVGVWRLDRETSDSLVKLVVDTLGRLRVPDAVHTPSSSSRTVDKEVSAEGPHREES